MTERIAQCRCGELRIACLGEPVRVSVCHCLDCQRRSGSAFAFQARWPEDRVAITGAFSEWSSVGDSGGRATFRFCPTCGGEIAYVTEGMPGVVAVPVGLFAEPTFPSPEYSVYEERKHCWVAVVGDGIDHYD